ncbi:MAG: YbjN domain-containing protein [Ignavibacteria bacterium]|nr:YbjN domain-containing protein [Ignavibacteria bacterium]
MQTADSTFDTTLQHVRKVLNGKFQNVVDFNDGSFAIPHGSSSVSVVVRAYTETETMIELMAQVVNGASLNEELLRWLLRKNVELHLGAFGLLFDDTIVFTYALTGGSISPSELEAAVTSVAVIADHYDDEIVAMSGGLRAVDL